MKFFTLRNGLILLAAEFILLALYLSNVDHNKTNVRDSNDKNVFLKGQNLRSLPDFNEFKKDFLTNGGAVDDVFYDYAKEIITKHGKKSIDSLINLSKTHGRDNQINLFILLTEHYGLNTAVSYIPSDLDDQLTQRIIHIIAATAAEKEPEAVIAWIQEKNPYLFTDDLILSQLMRSTILSFDKKMELMRTLPPGETRRTALDFLAQESVNSRGPNQRDILEKSKNFTSQQLDMYDKIYLHLLFEKNLSKGIDFLKGINYRSNSFDDINLQTYSRLSASGGLQQALDAISTVSNKPVRAELSKGALSVWVKSSPADAAAYAYKELSDGNDNGQLLQMVYSRWFSSDPVNALDHLNNLPLEETTREKILTDQFSVISTNHPDYAQEIINSYPPGPSADALRTILAFKITNNLNAEQRFSNIAQISQDKMRLSEARRGGQIMAFNHPEQTIQYIHSAPPSEFKDHVILGYAQIGFYDNNLDFADMPEVVDQVQDPEIKRDLMKEWFSREQSGDHAQEIKDAHQAWQASNPDLAREFLQENDSNSPGEAQ